MATIKSYTDLSQSKKLAEILPLESADMYWDLLSKSNYAKVNDIGYCLCRTCVYAWGLAALLDVLPYPYIEQNYKGKWTCRVEHGNTTYLLEDSNPINACVAMIEKLYGLNLL